MERVHITALGWLVLAVAFLGCPQTEPADDDDDSAAGDDDAGDDDAGDDDAGDDDTFYTDPGDLPEGTNPCRERVLVELLEAVDGDTAWVDMPSGPHEKIRVIGIDTPELGYEGDPDECYGPEAWAYAAHRLGDDRFWLTFDEECYDQYDRLLAYVHTRHGFFQLDMLEGGYATAFAVEPNVTFAAMFNQAEQEACSSGAGLWGACD